MKTFFYGPTVKNEPRTDSHKFDGVHLYVLMRSTVGDKGFSLSTGYRNTVRPCYEGKRGKSGGKLDYRKIDSYFKFFSDT
jgi:hypothetical protein